MFGTDTMGLGFTKKGGKTPNQVKTLSTYFGTANDGIGYWGLICADTYPYALGTGLGADYYYFDSDGNSDSQAALSFEQSSTSLPVIEKLSRMTIPKYPSSLEIDYTLSRTRSYVLDGGATDGEQTAYLYLPMLTANCMGCGAAQNPLSTSCTKNYLQFKMDFTNQAPDFEAWFQWMSYDKDGNSTYSSGKYMADYSDLTKITYSVILYRKGQYYRLKWTRTPEGGDTDTIYDQLVQLNYDLTIYPYDVAFGFYTYANQSQSAKESQWRIHSVLLKKTIVYP